MTTIMKDLGAWSAETISHLLGLSPSDLQIDLLGKDPTTDTYSARLTFPTKKEMQKIIQVYGGLSIPMTHGYHYYAFEDEADQGHGDGAVESMSPPLHLQLITLPSETLEQRVKAILNEETFKECIKYSQNKKDKLATHAAMVYMLAKTMGSRRINYFRGVPVQKGASVELLEYLRACTLWPSKEAQRKGVCSSNYLTVKKSHEEEYDTVWNLCHELIHSVIPDAVYNTLAITRGFRGSPHVNLHDKTYQHVIALGDFTGGHLCTEANDNGEETVAIDVHNRFGRIDGRSVHWVDAWRGERYSIVYYSTSDADWTKRVEQIFHMEWMQCHERQDVKTGKVPQKKYGTGNSLLPNSVPIVGLGCSSFSTFFSSTNEMLTVDTISKDHPVVQGWIETIQHAVLDRGIFLLDTAPWYGHGTSEKVLGYALDTILSNDLENAKSDGNFSIPARRSRTGLLPRSSLVINTKVGRYESDPLRQFDFSYSTTISSVFRSLERMNCDYIDVLQLHDPEFAPNMTILIEETIPALLECKKRGWTKAIGLTGYPLDVQHEILVKCSEEFDGSFVFDQSLVYCHNNLHDMSLFNDSCFAPDEADERGTHKSHPISYAEFCQQNGIYLMAAAPLSMGLLTNSGPPSWHPASSALKTACENAANLSTSKRVDISSLAMLYSLSQCQIGCTLIGMKDVREVDAAADLAERFSVANFDTSKSIRNNEGLSIILEEVLTSHEKETLLQLLDRTDGPFANVKARGDYRWDGKAEASTFWSIIHQAKKT